MPSCLSFLATRPPSPSFPPPPSHHHHHLLQSCNSVPPSCIPALSLSSFVVVLQSSCSRLPVLLPLPPLLLPCSHSVCFLVHRLLTTPNLLSYPLPLPSFLLPSLRILTPLPSYPLLLHYAIPLTSFTPRYPLHSFSPISTTPIQVKSSHKFGVRLARQPESLADSDTDVGYSNNNNLSPTDDQTSTRPPSKT